MKANELMIGDWVQNPLGAKGWVKNIRLFPKESDGLGGYYVIDIAYSKDGESYARLEEIDIKPIPLTEEILKANGFEKKGHRYGIYDDYFDFEMYEYNDGTWLVSYHCCEMSLPDEQVLIFHVHQLQHFMRHCAIDKVLKLEP